MKCSFGALQEFSIQIIDGESIKVADVVWISEKWLCNASTFVDLGVTSVSEAMSRGVAV